jgi:hypothetical protein
MNPALRFITSQRFLELFSLFGLLCSLGENPRTRPGKISFFGGGEVLTLALLATLPCWEKPRRAGARAPWFFPGESAAERRAMSVQRKAWRLKREVEAKGGAGHPKKSRGLLRKGIGVKFSFIAKTPGDLGAGDTRKVHH